MQTEIAHSILQNIMTFRRTPKAVGLCTDSKYCQTCLLMHLPKILSAVEQNEPIRFVLPAFPGKSPNPEKVLGPLPDFAEKLSLHFLQTLCHQIKKYYPPGIQIILCSDGRVFSDIVGITEENVSIYQATLHHMISDMQFSEMTMFNLDDCFQNNAFSQKRDILMKRYGNTLAFLQHKIQTGASSSASTEDQEANLMYRGITRFLFEDAMYAGQTQSRTAVQKIARVKAYDVIRRSNAWSELIAERYPEAVRLSIHPQVCGSQKLGIRLIASESWMTPWHGVALETKKGPILIKRAEAEFLGAELLYFADGRPSHYRLTKEHPIALEEK